MNTLNDNDAQTLRQSKEIDGGLKTETSHSEWAPPASVARLSREERSAAERKLKRKIDIRLLPVIVIMYILSKWHIFLAHYRLFGSKCYCQYPSRWNHSGSRTGRKPISDCRVHSFRGVRPLFFNGNERYILMQVPSNLFLDRIGKPAIYLPTCMIVWGTISSLTGAVNNYSGLLATRFFLGIVESAFFPGCLFFLSSWYTRKELAFRTAVLYSGSLISGAFSGLIAAGIVGGLDGARGLSAWRWMFVITLS
jgi:Major Facilitator Superfamily